VDGRRGLRHWFNRIETEKHNEIAIYPIVLHPNFRGALRFYSRPGSLVVDCCACVEENQVPSIT
jgi:hypothetical protein